MKLRVLAPILGLGLVSGASAQYHLGPFGPAMGAGETQSPQPCGSLTDGLIRYWDLDESSGNATDSTASVVLTNNNIVLYSPGKHANAADFDTTKSLSMASVVMPNSFTIVLWVKFGVTGGRGVSGCNANNATEAQFVIYENGGAEIIVGDGTAYTYSRANPPSGASMLNDGQWHLIFAWFDYAEKKPYIQVDGGTVNDEVAGAALSGTPYRTAATFAIGATGAVYQSLVGSVDEYAMYDRVLSPAERECHLRQGSGRFFDGTRFLP